MAIAHDAQTRFPTTDGTVGVNSVDTTTGDRSFTHTPVGVPKGVVVVVCVTGTTQPCSGVTYDGVAMTLEQSAVDTTEAGSVWIWVLAGVEIPTTDPATVVLQGCIATGKWATCSTVTAATTGTTIVGENKKDTTVATNPTLTVVTSATSLLYGGLHGGAASPASYVVTANYTSQFNNDYGALVARSSRRTSPVASGSIVYDFTFGTSDDYCIAAVALGEFELPITGTGALAAQASTIDGAGVSSSTGTGSPDAQASVIDGAGASSSTGTGALVAQASSIDGEGTSGTSEVTGTGALAAAASELEGAGLSLSVGAGALAAQASDVTGAGVSVSTGAGAAIAQASQVAGVGLSLSVGTGALAAQPAVIDGAGLSATVGTGALTAQASAVDGAGVSLSAGAGVMAAQASAVDGAGVSLSTGTGTLFAGASSIDGSDVQGEVTGTGALAAQSAGISGVGVSLTVGTGALVAQLADMAGAGVSLSLGMGALVSLDSSVSGTDEEPEPVGSGPFEAHIAAPKWNARITLILYNAKVL